MSTLFVYSLILSVSLSVFMGLYYILSGRLTFFTFNRVLLLTGLVVSVLIPVAAFVHSPSGMAAIESGQVAAAVLPQAAGGEVVRVAALSSSPLWDWCVRIYVCGVIFAAVYFLFAVARLLLFIYCSERFVADGRSIVVHDNNNLVPFSWGGHIVVSRKDFESYERMVILHESAHLDGCHWADLLFAQTVITIAWYCPAAWLMRSALQAVHEYLADRKVISADVSIKDYQLFLIKKTVGARLESIANSLRNSSLKNRITMMQSKRSNGLARMRALAMVPVMALLLTGVSSADVRAAVTVLSHSAQSEAASEVVAPAVADDNTKVYEATEIPPQFPGGEAELMQFVARNLKYPEGYTESGRVILQFVITDKGTIGDIRVLRSGLPEVFNQECIRVVKSLPAFEPGKMKGKPAACWYTMPFTFRVVPKETKEQAE